MSKKQAGFATRSIHVGNEPDPSTGAVAPPIFATSTYAQEELGKTKGYDYSRAGNPTRTRLEQNLASLEGGIAAPVFASGMAAVGALCQLMKSGDHVVASNNLYGGVPRLFNQVVWNPPPSCATRIKHHKEWGKLVWSSTPRDSPRPGGGGGGVFLGANKKKP